MTVQAGGPVPVYDFGVRLNQKPSHEQATALREVCPDDRWIPVGLGAWLRCSRQAESLPAAIARVFEDIAQVSGLAPLWVDIDLDDWQGSVFKQPGRGQAAANRAA